jgi:hypothetical protein
MHSSGETIRSHCQNCGAELNGPYCHACGQHDFDVHQSFGHLALELLATFFHFDGKFFRGTFDLLFRPGSLTKEFNAGKRASQVPPLRLYIFISLIFFLAPGAGIPEPIAEQPSALSPRRGPGTTRAEPDATATSVGNQTFHLNFHTNTRWNRIIREKLRRPDLIQDHFFHYLPKMMLVCVPLFALLSLLIFRKAGLNYLQHLVFSLHLHSFFMLFQLVSDGWALMAGLISGPLASLLSIAGMLYMPVYAYRALRNVFGQHRRGTLLRGILLLSLYGLVIILGFLGTLLAAVLLA